MYRVSGPVVGVVIQCSDTKLFLFGDVHGSETRGFTKIGVKKYMKKPWITTNVYTRY